MDIQIKVGKIDQAVELHSQIPEFDDVNVKMVYRDRLFGKDPLILIAYTNQKAVGFIMGYNEKDYFYSWMGGVIPKCREKGVASKLAGQQEDLVKKMGVFKIRFKTQNKYKGMLIFALKNGFSILGTVPFKGGEGFKILLEKELN